MCVCVCVCVCARARACVLILLITCTFTRGGRRDGGADGGHERCVPCEKGEIHNICDRLREKVPKVGKMLRQHSR